MSISRRIRWLRTTMPFVIACTPACSASDGNNDESVSYGGAGGGAMPVAVGGMSNGGASIVGSGGNLPGSGGTPIGSGGIAPMAGGTTGAMTLPPAVGGASAGGTAGSGNVGGIAGSVGGGGQSSGGAAGATSGGSSNGGAAGGGGAAGSAGSGGSAQSPCDGGKVGTDSSMLRTVTAYGKVYYQLPTSNHIVDLQTVLKVPKKPMATGTLFVWPGLQSLGGPDPARIGNGVLQPVLTWGTSCQMGSMSYNEWWIAGMYVNVSTGAAGPTGCMGGDTMNVGVGDLLDIDMSLGGTTWKQVVVDEQTSKSVDFSMDLKGQAQNWAIFDIEQPYGTAVSPPEDIVFTDTVISFASPATSCQPSQRGTNDYFAAPVLSTDGLHCCFAKITLRARGVPATTMP